jgi:hypothetical protein
MLDYLADRCIQAALHCRTPLSPLQRDAAFQAADEALHLVNDLLTLFAERHPTHNLTTHDPKLRFRLLLLKFTVLFTQRYRPGRGQSGERCAAKPSRAALNKLRDENTTRARRWIGSAERLPTNGRAVASYERCLPLSRRALEEGREKVLQACNPMALSSATNREGQRQNDDSDDESTEDDETAYSDPSTTLTLLDMLPLFMQVSAACHGFLPEDSPVTAQWMKLFNEVALQSCLEQYLVFGASGTDCIDEAFAWVVCEDDVRHTELAGQEEDESHSAVEIEAMLRTAEESPDEDDDGNLIPKWSSILSTTIDRLFPTIDLERVKARGNDNILHNHLHALSLRLPLADTDERIRTFIAALATCGDGDQSSLLPRPVLAQLERGRLEGMTEEDTLEFLEETCGINPERWGLDIRLLSPPASRRTSQSGDVLRGVDFLDIPGMNIGLIFI